MIPTADMVQKIRVASDSRSSKDFLIIARTDSRTGLGLDEAMRRMEAYAKAGADILFIEAPETEAEMETIGKRFDQPLLANMVNGGKTPMLPAKRLAELGYRIAIFPATGFLATAAALESAYRRVEGGRHHTGKTPMYAFSDFNKLIGFPDVWEFEKKYGVGE